MSFPDEPKFLNETFMWRKKGYFYCSPPPENLLEPEILNSDNPWLVLAGTLEQAKNGNITPIDGLMSFIQSQSEGTPSFVASCLWLIGDAGSSSQASYLVDAMSPSQSDYVRVKACDAAKHAGFLWLVPHILDVWKTISLRERSGISNYLSKLLEPVAGPVFDFTRFDCDEEYVEFIYDKISFVETKLGSKDAIVFRGEEFGVQKLAKLMDEILSSRETAGVLASEFGVLRHRFEATTGIDCSAFYMGEKFRQLEAISIIETFLDSKEFQNYKNGERYFFSHKIK